MTGARIADPGRRILLAAGAAALAGCAGLRGNGGARPVRAGAATAPTVRVGDRWRYVRIDRYRGKVLGEVVARVTAAEPRIVVALADRDGAPLGEEAYAGAWNVVREPFYDMPIVFDAPVTIVPAGAAPGESLASATRYRVAGDRFRTYYWSERLDVHAWESVEVPAGRFDALRIERRISFQHPDWTRHSSERVDTAWYAPAVERWVRRTWTGTYLLPGRPPTSVREDWVDWRLLDYSPAR